MKIFKNVQDFLKGGWFIGDFEPTCFKTTYCEASYKIHKKGEFWDKHYHKQATEINYLIKGKLKIQNQEINSGDVFIMLPNDISDPIFIEDCEVICIKIPGIKNDKYIVPRGLKYIPDLGSEKENNRDNPLINKKVPQEFSPSNHEIIKKEIISMGDKCKTILEIGIDRNAEKSSTKTILKYKSEDCIYIGVDINPKEYLQDKNVHTIQCSSSEYEKIINFIKEKTGRETIDLIHIDGYHSVNQILNDWKFTNNIPNHGTIILHDASDHPGPTELIKSLDTDFWKIKTYFINDPNDWGIAVIKINENNIT